MAYKISDAVAMRMIQIFQEALLLGVDGADLMRQVRLVVDPQDTGSLTLDPEYVKFVEDSHKKYLADVETLKTSRGDDSQVLIFDKS